MNQPKKLNVNAAKNLSIMKQQESKVEPATFGEMLFEKAQGRSISNARLTDLHDIARLLNEGYGTHELLERITICDGSEGMEEFTDQAILTISPEDFHTSSSGLFQFKLMWPKVNDDGDLVVKVSINYKPDPDGHNTLLSTGGGDGSKQGFVALNSNEYKLNDLMRLGYIEASAADTVYKWAVRRIDDTKAMQLLTPQSDVITVLRATRVPLNSKKDTTTTKKPGELANLGMSTIYFQEATLLNLSNGLRGDVKNPAIPEATFAELYAKYGPQEVTSYESTIRPATHDVRPTILTQAHSSLDSFVESVF
jgi:hypothetical protein